MYISDDVKNCKRILNSRKMMIYDFSEQDYIWEIGANILNNIILDYEYNHNFPFTRKTESTGKLFNVDYRIVPNNDALKLVRKTDNLYLNFIVASRQSGKTNKQLKMGVYLEEMMKKWNRGIVNNNQSIKNVIFNNPATIVFWSDGTKTVVKAEGEPFDPEKGLAMAIAKKSLGNKGDYYDEFKKWLPKEEAKWKDPAKKVCSSCKYFSLSPSSSRICLECLKDETLPNWEKADKEEIKELISLTCSKEDGNCDNAEKNCDDCKYNEQTDIQLRCFTCEYAGVGPLKQPCCDCAKNMGFSYYREKKDD